MGESNRFENSDLTAVLNVAQEYKEVSEFLTDDQVDRALILLVKLLRDPNGPSQIAIPGLIVELQAISTHCALKATYYQTIGKSEPDSTHKKNLYYTFRDAFIKLTDSVKYMLK